MLVMLALGTISDNLRLLANKRIQSQELRFLSRVESQDQELGSRVRGLRVRMFPPIPFRQ